MNEKTKKIFSKIFSVTDAFIIILGILAIFILLFPEVSEWVASGVMVAYFTLRIVLGGKKTL